MKFANLKGLAFSAYGWGLGSTNPEGSNAEFRFQGLGPYALLTLNPKLYSLFRLPPTGEHGPSNEHA